MLTDTTTTSEIYGSNSIKYDDSSSLSSSNNLNVTIAHNLHQQSSNTQTDSVSYQSYNHSNGLLSLANPLSSYRSPSINNTTSLSSASNKSNNENNEPILSSSSSSSSSSLLKSNDLNNQKMIQPKNTKVDNETNGSSATGSFQSSILFLKNITSKSHNQKQAPNIGNYFSSMKNINEISNSNASLNHIINSNNNSISKNNREAYSIKNEVSYNSLQQALKAATAALQKSTNNLLAAENMHNSKSEMPVKNQLSQSQNNIKYTTIKPTMIKNKIFKNIKMNNNENDDENSWTLSSSPINKSAQLSTISTATRKSSFQPYNKGSNLKKQLHSSSSASSTASSSSSASVNIGPKNADQVKLFRNTFSLIIDNNNNKCKQTCNKTESDGNSDYDNIEEEEAVVVVSTDEEDDEEDKIKLDKEDYQNLKENQNESIAHKAVELPFKNVTFNTKSLVTDLILKNELFVENLNSNRNFNKNNNNSILSETSTCSLTTSSQNTENNKSISRNSIINENSILKTPFTSINTSNNKTNNSNCNDKMQSIYINGMNEASKFNNVNFFHAANQKKITKIISNGNEKTTNVDNLTSKLNTINKEKVNFIANNNLLMLKRKKSASTEHINSLIINKCKSDYCVAKYDKILDVCENKCSSKLVNENNNQKTSYQNGQKSQEDEHQERQTASPPPPAKFRTTLSKSLFSLIIKPQPFRPTVQGSNANGVNNNKTTFTSVSNYNKNKIKSPVPVNLVNKKICDFEESLNTKISVITVDESSYQTTSCLKNKSLKKCISTTYLNNEYEDNINENISNDCNSLNKDKKTRVGPSKSVSFLNKIGLNNESSSKVMVISNTNSNADTLSDNSLIDDDDDDTSNEDLIKDDNGSKYVKLNSCIECLDIDYEDEINNENKVDLDEKDEDIEEHDNKSEHVLHFNYNTQLKSNKTNHNDHDETFKKQINNLERSLDGKMKEVEILKLKLKQEKTKNKLLKRNRDSDLEELIEEEKQIYEQKLNSMRIQFDQQVKICEQNGRNILQEKMNNLQNMYNELKSNFEKNLNNECKELRQKLLDSQLISSQLAKQLQLIKNQQKINNNSHIIKNKLFYNNMRSISTSTQTNNTFYDENTILNKQFLNTELQQQQISYMNKLKQENNELKYQMECERHYFKAEREKWLNEKQKLMKFQPNLISQNNRSSEINLKENDGNTFKVIHQPQLHPKNFSNQFKQSNLIANKINAISMSTNVLNNSHIESLNISSNMAKKTTLS